MKKMLFILFLSIAILTTHVVVGSNNSYASSKKSVMTNEVKLTMVQDLDDALKQVKPEERNKIKQKILKIINFFNHKANVKKLLKSHKIVLDGDKYNFKVLNNSSKNFSKTIHCLNPKSRYDGENAHHVKIIVHKISKILVVIGFKLIADSAIIIILLTMPIWGPIAAFVHFIKLNAE